MFFVGFHLYSESLYSHKDLCPFSINLRFVSFIRSTLLPRDLLLDLFPITDGRELFAVRVHENGADLKKLRTKVIFVALVKSTCGTSFSHIGYVITSSKSLCGNMLIKLNCFSAHQVFVRFFPLCFKNYLFKR